MKTYTKSGFSLIELLVVTTIIIVLGTIGIVSYRSAGESARDGRRKADLNTVRQALVLYKSDNGGYPNSSGTTDEERYAALVATLLADGYLSEPTPYDPQGLVTDPKYKYIPGGACPSLCSAFTLVADLENTNEPTFTLTNP